MRTTINAVISALMLCLGTITLPAVAADGIQPAVATIDNTGDFIPVIFKSGIKDMEVEEIAAIAAGAAVVGSLADMFFESGIGTILGVAVGASLGSHWYEEGWWPFKASSH